MNSTKKMKKIILAIPIAAPAMVVKPNMAATIAIIKKIITNEIIKKSLFCNMLTLYKPLQWRSLRVTRSLSTV